MNNLFYIFGSGIQDRTTEYSTEDTTSYTTSRTTGHSTVIGQRISTYQTIQEASRITEFVETEEFNVEKTTSVKSMESRTTKVTEMTQPCDPEAEPVEEIRTSTYYTLVENVSTTSDTSYRQKDVERTTEFQTPLPTQVTVDIIATTNYITEFTTSNLTDWLTSHTTLNY